MSYVLDSGFFVVSRGYYPDTFPSFWEKLTEAANTGIILSVSEVRKEIENYGGGQQHLLDWILENKSIFEKPTREEQEKVAEIMKKFPESLPKQEQLSGGIWADPFVIAKAGCTDATVVTKERSARDKGGHVPSKVKIPDICQELKVKCISPQGFMKEQKWVFK